MRTYTDIALVCNIEGIDDLSAADEVNITFRQGGRVINKRDGIINGNSVTVDLTQRDTGRFNASMPIEVQANIILYGKRVASNIVPIEINDNILRRVITIG